MKINKYNVCGKKQLTYADMGRIIKDILLNSVNLLVSEVRFEEIMDCHADFAVGYALDVRKGRERDV